MVGPASHHMAPQTPSSDLDDGSCEVCWVCLGDGTQEELKLPCKCPRPVHTSCLARWQLQSAGRSEEQACRFCHSTLPDWRPSLTPPGLRPASPVMSIHHNGETHLVKVSPGPEGLLRFQAEVRRLLRLQDDQEFEISFECKVPGDVSKMELKGMTSYDAAVYCASITAAERLKQAQELAAAAQAQDSPAPPPCPCPRGPVAPPAALAPARNLHSSSGAAPAASSLLPSGHLLRPAASDPTPAPAPRPHHSVPPAPTTAPSTRLPDLLRRHAARLLQSCRATASCLSPSPRTHSSRPTSSARPLQGPPAAVPRSSGRGFTGTAPQLPRDRHSAGAVPFAARPLPPSLPPPLTSALSSPGTFTSSGSATHAASRPAQSTPTAPVLDISRMASARPPLASRDADCPPHSQERQPSATQRARDPTSTAAMELQQALALAGCSRRGAEGHGAAMTQRAVSCSGQATPKQPSETQRAL